MTKEQKQQVDLLQTNLSSIRKIAGWTLDELGEKIGVTKQTISNLETKKTNMTLTQYIAIRAVLDYEIQNNKDNHLLGTVVSILLDKSKDLPDKQRKQIQQQFSDISKMAVSGVSQEIIRDTLANIAITGIPGIPPILPMMPSVGGLVALKIVSNWMSYIQQNNKKKSNNNKGGN